MNGTITSSYGDLVFSCLEVSINENAEVPTYPLDSNSVITDNIIIGNMSLSCKIMVEYANLDSFEDIMKKGNLDKSGFEIRTLSKLLSNMRWTSKSYTESSDNVGGVICDLNFLEIRYVEAKTGFISYTKTQPKYASKQKTGKVEVKSEEESCKKQMRGNIRQYLYLACIYSFIANGRGLLNF